MKKVLNLEIKTMKINLFHKIANQKAMKDKKRVMEEDKDTKHQVKVNTEILIKAASIDIDEAEVAALLINCKDITAIDEKQQWILRIK